MDLRGRIDLFGVPNIFQLLSQAEATGKLVLEGESERGRVYFHEGRLVYARTDAPMERIGDALVRQGILEPAQLEGARIQAECKERRIGSVLVDATGRSIAGRKHRTGERGQGSQASPTPSSSLSA